MKHDTLLQMVQSIIDTLVNVSGASVNSMRSFLSKTIFKVEVTNPVSKMEVTNQLQISNLKGLEDGLKNNALAIRELKKPIESDKKVKVTNLSDIKFPAFPKFPLFPKSFKVDNFPREFRISNLEDLVPALKKMAEMIEKIDVRPEVKVEAPVVKVEAPSINIPKQEPPIVNVAAPDLKDLTKLIEFFTKLGERNPLPVRLSDGQKFYKALERMAEIYAGSSFSAFQDSTGHDGRAILNRNNEIQTTTSETWDANDVEVVNSTLTYFGEESVDGRWRVRKVVKSGSFTSIRHATIRNNSNYTNYQEAWDDRANLEFGYAREAL